MNFTNIARGKRKDNPNEWVYGYYYCVFECERLLTEDYHFPNAMNSIITYFHLAARVQKTKL